VTTAVAQLVITLLLDVNVWLLVISKDVPVIAVDEENRTTRDVVRCSVIFPVLLVSVPHTDHNGFTTINTHTTSSSNTSN